MGTSVSSLTSAATSNIGLTANSSSSSSSSSGSSTNFTGTSQYSADLQNVISHAVAVATLPITLLQNQQTTLTDQSKEMSTLDGLLSTLQTSVDSIQSAMDGSSFTADVSDTAVASATLTDGAQEGVYPIEVQDIGSYASGATKSDWGTPASNATFKLVVGGQSYAISSSDTSASGIASAINAQYGNMVQATVLNVGSGSSADTRLSLQAISLGAQTLDLQTSAGASLFTQNVGGSLAEYSIPGTGAASVTTNSRQVQISPGVTLTMLAANPDEPVDVTVTRPTSTLSTALSSFADAYNAVVDEVAKQRGQNAGPLQGSTVLQSISQTLSQLSTYSTSTGDVNSLNNLGFELDKNGDGHLTFTSMNLAATDIGDASGVDAFLGNSSTGGFLQMATNALSGLEDSTTGIVKNAETDLQTQITDIGNTITTKQAQVTQMTTNLTNQMAQADALLSSLQQQYESINELFQAEQTSIMGLTLG
ncbi:MAG TPA: flagellar filament capping protein FliD [Bryobacteraceae bacterium]|nr:flagellar filament capping protein FliD [Bryobacteraceae bacterium]